MTLLRPVAFDSGETVLIEVHERRVDGETRRVSLGEKASKTFDNAWKSVMPLVRTFEENLATSGAEQAQVKFGVKVGSDFDAFVAGVSAEANFEVTLIWRPRTAAPKNQTSSAP